jgi:alpha/beta superfamily hydrolase
MKESRVMIPCQGIRLEGLLNLQEALSIKPGVIFCHPHPQYGGDMDNAVISTAVEVAIQEGLSTLRFNFRGVGASGGSYAECIGEQEDVKASIDYFHSRLNDTSPRLILVGYSFGAWAGMPVAVGDDRIRAMVAIAPPLELYNFEFLKGCRKDKQVIAGSRDDFCPVPLLEKFYQTLEEPKSLAIIPGADHFFSFHLQSLTQPLRNFFRNR